jgi:tellurite resistance protein TerC
MRIAFIAIVIVLLVLALGVLHRKVREIELGESLTLSVVYISLGLAFGAWVWWYLGPQSSVEYLTGFAIEKTLAMDNVFVIAMIFTFFAIPRLHQQRVLFWGILGVIVLRAIMIGMGAPLVERFGGLLYVFALFLIATGINMLWFANAGPPDLSQNVALKWMRGHLRVTDQLHGETFFVSLPGAPGTAPQRYMTPLFLALIMIGIADLIFAVDSVPAIFWITTDPFIVYRSNIFAILCLRALYVALAAMEDRFRCLKYALSILLTFIGSKIFIAWAMGWEKFPRLLSLGVTAAILASGILYSLWRTRAPAAPPAARTQAVLASAYETEVRNVLNGMRLVSWDRYSPRRDGSSRTLKSEEPTTDGTRSPAALRRPAGSADTASGNSRAITRLSSCAGRAFQSRGSTMPSSSRSTIEPPGTSIVAI